eukprot:Gregarina_sp_Poly_1__9859@NODE_637_length_7019_cov_92_159235_g486_i0_p6_GENE_NODE_637_length_7019_cov_92_159235_g486_i0NODE_637_length_7019_cov_92_159235_g486_i0_p6_ORF_typecomplete_len117_score17_21DUF2706/PF10913_8/0_19_NODE_637_length_7019_cov_92_159235_g486_i062316581
MSTSLVFSRVGGIISVSLSITLEVSSSTTGAPFRVKSGAVSKAECFVTLYVDLDCHLRSETPRKSVPNFTSVAMPVSFLMTTFSNQRSATSDSGRLSKVVLPLALRYWHILRVMTV